MMKFDKTKVLTWGAIWTWCGICLIAFLAGAFAVVDAAL